MRAASSSHIVTVAATEAAVVALERVLKTHQVALAAVRAATTTVQLRIELAEHIARDTSEMTQHNTVDPMIRDARPYGGPVEPFPGQRSSPTAAAVPIGGVRIVRIVGIAKEAARSGSIGATRVTEVVLEVDEHVAQTSRQYVLMRSTFLVRLYGRHALAAAHPRKGDLLDVVGQLGLHPTYSLDENVWHDYPVVHVFGSAGSVECLSKCPAAAVDGSSEQAAAAVA